MTKLYRVLDLINRLLGEYNPVVRVVEHYVANEGDVEYLNVKINIPHGNTVVAIREYWQRDSLVAYGYYLRAYDHEEWWDNRPHHPEIQTHPHHKHLGEKVQPLRDPSLEKFLNAVRQILHKRST
ncbi:MAG: DUF6516 family protein [Thermoprotei archaeon]